MEHEDGAEDCVRNRVRVHEGDDDGRDVDCGDDALGGPHAHVIITHGAAGAHAQSSGRGWLISRTNNQRQQRSPGGFWD